MKKEAMPSHQQTAQPAKNSHYLAVSGLLFGAVCWGIIENQLSDGRPYVEGDGFTIADICLGVFARRWFGEERK